VPTVQPEKSRPKIIIVGGGFAGVNTTRMLIRKVGREADITLISDHDYHDYKPCLFRIVEGYSATETYIPLNSLIDETHLIIDSMKTADLEKKMITCESGVEYGYDYLVIATGSRANFHGVPIIGDMTFTVNSTKEAVRLREHIRKTIQSIPAVEEKKKVSLGHFVIVGGGGTGVEMAAAVARNARKTAIQMGVDPSLITVDLFQASSRILDGLRPEISDTVDKRLRSLDVNIFYHRRLMKEHLEDVFLGDLHIKADTIIWTAGIQPKPVIPYDTETIDDHLNVMGHPEVYIIGDAGKDKHYGLAQTALEHAKYVSKSIQDKMRNKNPSPYIPKPVSYAVPVGTGWAAIQMSHSEALGLLGWLIRRFVDIRYMIIRLPLGQTWNIFSGNQRDDDALKKKILGETDGEA
jgi:NADH:quinone reductase (non-electrogenic)